MDRAKIALAVIFGCAVGYLYSCNGGNGVDRNKDTDGDGMPDWWEITYGLDPNDPSDSDKDLDRDGWTSLEEYQNGTDPWVPDPPKELCNGQDDDGNGLIDEIWLGKGTPCGMCGTNQCSAGGLSLKCQGQGVCSPGDNQYCGSNGMKTCLDTCQWNECLEALQCMTGEEQTSKCGYCQEGAQTRVCGFEGKWGIWSDCLGRGCQPAAAQACEIEGKPGTQECSNECKWGECVANCNPGDKFTASCGDCGGTRNRTCRTDGNWSGWNVCQCADQTESQDFPGYGTQTRTCGQESQCEWTPWTNCTLDGAECDADEVETQACGCGQNGSQMRICDEICVWSEWSQCEGDFDNTPPSIPAPAIPAQGETFLIPPVTLGWLASSDDCGMRSDAYEVMLSNQDYYLPVTDYTEPVTGFPDPPTLAYFTSDVGYRFDTLPGGRYLWWVRAWDAAENVSNFSPGRSFTLSESIIFQELFEEMFPGRQWNAVDENIIGGEDYWAKSDYRFSFGSYSAWCAGIGDQGDSDCGTAGSNNVSIHYYDNEMKAVMEKTFDLHSYSFVTLSWWYWMEVADPEDCLAVRVRGQSGEWVLKWERRESSIGWAYDFLGLNEYAGQAGVTLQFRFESDGAGHCAEGAYLDDIVVEGW